MPHRSKNPAVIAIRRESQKIATLHEEPHVLGLNALPTIHQLPTPLEQIPRVGDVTVSFRKIETEIPRS